MTMVEDLIMRYATPELEVVGGKALNSLTTADITGIRSLPLLGHA